jgi:hypothetical protein
MAKGLRQGSGGGSNSQGLQDMLNKIKEAEKSTGQTPGRAKASAKAAIAMVATTPDKA